MRLLTTIVALGVLCVAPAMAGMGSKVTSRYDPGVVAALAAGGMPTVVRGAIGSADAVIGLMRPPGWMSAGSFVPAASTTQGTRLVFLIAPADAVAAKRDVCEDPDALDYGAQGSRLVIRAALCEGDRFVSRATASERPVSGIDDQRFARIVNHMILLLMPQATRFQVDPPN